MFRTLFSSGATVANQAISNASAKIKVKTRAGEVPSVDLRLWSHGGCMDTACAVAFDSVQRILAVSACDVESSDTEGFRYPFYRDTARIYLDIAEYMHFIIIVTARTLMAQIAQCTCLTLHGY